MLDFPHFNSTSPKKVSREGSTGLGDSIMTAIVIAPF